MVPVLIIIDFDGFILLRLLLNFCFYLEDISALETVLHRLSEHLAFRKIYSVGRRILNCLLGVCISR